MKIFRENYSFEHPFLFVSSGINQRTGESFEGAPYSMSSYDKSFSKALDRLELKLNKPIPRGRGGSINPHALRHHYAKVMAEAGVPPKVIQSCLHHRAINSQEAYKGLSPEKISKILEGYKII